MQRHICDLISGPPQSVHMWQAPLCTLTVIGPENSIEIDGDNYSIYYTYGIQLGTRKVGENCMEEKV